MTKMKYLAILLAPALAGAQTVTVGSTSSSTNGSTTTITVPVSVAVPPATTATLPSLASLSVQAGSGNGSALPQTLANSFETIAMPNVIIDTASGWNATANTYTVPTTGTYLIISTIRLVDSAPAGISWGQGVNTTNVDNPFFFWVTTAGIRNGFQNSRVMQLTAGQTVDLFAYADTSHPVSLSSASLSIQQLY